MSTAHHTVHVRVTDAATGQPTPVRVRFTDAHGQYLPPLGRLVEFATGENEDVGGNLQLGAKKFAYTDGSFEIPLPAGPIHVEISKGPEYGPIHETIDLPAGKLALRFSIARWSDLRAQGWYSGDARLHFLPPHAALLEAAAEDVAVANLLAAEAFIPSLEVIREDPYEEHFLRFPAIPNLLAFSGQQSALSMPGHMVVVNTLNHHPALGNLALLNCHRVVHPLAFGDWRGDNWTLAAWCDQCHRKGGLVVWAEVAEHPVASFGEALADLILGKIDAVEAALPAKPNRAATRFAFGPARHIWYTLLNCGFHVPLVGASGKRSNREPVGAVRTYAQLLPNQELTYGNWLSAVREGRTFATTGPLLKLTVNELGPGSVVGVGANSAAVRVRAEARSITPFRELELVFNGNVIERAAASEPNASAPVAADIEAEVPLRESGWLAARCTGKPAADVVAHTSPVYVKSEGSASPLGPPGLTAAETLRAYLDKALDWVEHRAHCQSGRERENLASIIRDAQHILQHRAAGL